MKIGIIGHRGFVGSAFYELFSQDKKYDAVGIDRQNYASMAGSHFDILINANGNSSKRLADLEPLKDFEMNVSATARALHDFKYGHYVHISTIEVYGDKARKETTREGAAIDPGKLSNYGFSKRMGELLVGKYASSWLILRLGGMIGKNMKKGPAYDILNLGKLFISEKSRFQFINTAEVAHIAKKLIEMGKFGETYNVVGKGNIALGDFARIAGVRLSNTGNESLVFDVSTEKIERETGVSATFDTVKKIAEQGL